MSVEEKYTRAVASSNLATEEYPCDVDMLIAAGWLPRGLSTEVYRLRVEVEGVDKKALGRANHSLVDWVLVQSHLQSLPKARDFFGSYARQLARRDHPQIHDEDAEVIAAQVLGHMMMPTCPVCEGRQYEVPAGSPSLSHRACKACKGTGIRPLKVGQGEARRDFALDLKADIERKMAHLFGLMARFSSTRLDLEPASPHAAAERVVERCTAILKANPNDGAARNALAAAQEKLDKGYSTARKAGTIQPPRNSQPAQAVDPRTGRPAIAPVCDG